MSLFDRIVEDWTEKLHPREKGRFSKKAARSRPTTQSAAPSWMAWHSEDKIMDTLKRSAGKVIAELRGRGVQIGELIDCGMFGCVYQHATDKTRVFKVERGDNETRLARFILDNPEVQKLTSLPKIVAIHETTARDELTNLPLHVFEREDLDDLFKKGPQSDAEWGSEKQARYMGEACRLLQIAGLMPAETEEDQVHLTDTLDQIQSLLTVGGEAKEFDQASKDIRALIEEYGVVPHDLHEKNWGKRKDGTVVVRDIGSYGLIG